MGNKSSSTVSTDTYVHQVHKVRTGMSDRDRRLYNFARLKIAEENLDNAEITVDFQDQSALILRGENPSGKVHIGYNFYDQPELVWKKRGFFRSVKRFFIGCFSTLKRAMLDALAIGGASAMRYITFR